MQDGVLGQLCRTITADGLQLDGVLFEPVQPSKDLPVTAFLLVHGTGSHFYAAGVLERFAEQALSAGVSVLRINTRGHDSLTRIASSTGYRLIGAAYEVISECRYDIAAWVQFLERQGHTQIGLVGHSMGAVKVLYAQSVDQDQTVQRVVGISPPRFCHQQLMSHTFGMAFGEDYHKAKEMVSQGQGGELLSVRQPLPMLLSAESFLAKYGPQDDYDYIKFLPQLSCPSLILLGTESVRTSPAFAGVPEELNHLHATHPQLPLSYRLINGANTAYSNHLSDPFHSMEAWLQEPV